MTPRTPQNPTTTNNESTTPESNKGSKIDAQTGKQAKNILLDYG